MTFSKDYKSLLHALSISLLITASSGSLYAQVHTPFIHQNKSLIEAKDQFAQKLYANANQSAYDYLELQDNTYNVQPASAADRAKYYSVVSQLKLNKINSAENAVAYISSTANPVYKQRAAYILAQYYFRKGELNNAATYYELAGISNLDNKEIADAKFELAYCYFNNNQFNQAEPLLASIKEIGGKYYDAGNYYYGLLAYNQGNYNDALKSFKLVEDKADYKEIVPYYIAEIHYFLGDKQTALNNSLALINAPQKSYYDNELHLLAGQVYFEEQNYKTALPYFEHYYDNTERIRKEDLYEMAFCYYKLKDWDNAIEYFKPLSDTRDSLGQTSMYLLGDCYLNTNDKKSARNAFSICADMPYNRAQKEAALLLAGKLSYELGYNNDAIYYLNILLADFSNSVHTDDAKTILSDLLTRTRNYQEAYAALEDVSKRDKNYSRVLQKVAYGYAIQQVQQNNIAFADSLLSISLENKVDPTYQLAATFWKGEVSYKLNRYNDAYSYAKRFIDQDNYKAYAEALSPQATDKNAYLTLGYASMELSKYNDAQNYFAKAKTISYGADSNAFADILLKEADAAFMQKDYSTAVSIYDEVITSGNGNVDYATYQKAIISGLEGNNAKKSTLLKSLVSQQPPSKYAVESRYELGLTLIEENKYKQAIQTLTPLTEAYEVRNIAPKAWMKIGFAYQQDNNTSKAIESYKKIIEEYVSSEERPAALDAIKNLYIQSGKPEEYAKLLKKNDLGDVEENMLDSTYYATAEAKYADGDWQAASKLLETYIDKYPTGVFIDKAHYYLAESYYQLGKNSEALKNYDVVLESQWSNFSENSARRAAAIAFALNDAERAKNYYGQLRNMAMDQETLNSAYNGLMLSSYKLKQLEDAAAYADTLLSLPGLDESVTNRALLYRAQSLKQTGDLNNALSAYQQLQSAKISSVAAEAKYNVAAIYYEKEMLKEAEKAANEAIQQGGNDYWVVKSFLLISDILIKQEDYFNAKATLQSIIRNSKIKDIKQEAEERLQKVKALESKKSKLSEE